MNVSTSNKKETKVLTFLGTFTEVHFKLCVNDERQRCKKAMVWLRQFDTAWGMWSLCQRRYQQVNERPSVSRPPDHSSPANCTKPVQECLNQPGEDSEKGNCSYYRRPHGVWSRSRSLREAAALGSGTWKLLHLHAVFIFLEQTSGLAIRTETFVGQSVVQQSTTFRLRYLDKYRLPPHLVQILKLPREWTLVTFCDLTFLNIVNLSMLAKTTHCPTHQRGFSLLQWFRWFLISEISNMTNLLAYSGLLMNIQAYNLIYFTNKPITDLLWRLQSCTHTFCVKSEQEISDESWFSAT